MIPPRYNVLTPGPGNARQIRGRPGQRARLMEQRRVLDNLRQENPLLRQPVFEQPAPNPRRAAAHRARSASEGQPLADLGGLGRLPAQRPPLLTEFEQERSRASEALDLARTNDQRDDGPGRHPAGAIAGPQANVARVALGFENTPPWTFRFHLDDVGRPESPEIREAVDSIRTQDTRPCSELLLTRQHIPDEVADDWRLVRVTRPTTDEIIAPLEQAVARLDDWIGGNPNANHDEARSLRGTCLLGLDALRVFMHLSPYGPNPYNNTNELQAAALSVLTSDPRASAEVLTWAYNVAAAARM